MSSMNMAVVSSAGGAESIWRDAGFSIELDEDPAAEMIEATRQMLSAPPAELTTAMFIDDIETKGPRYMQNLAEHRTALALVVATAV